MSQPSRTPVTEYLELADWRRQVAAAWDDWRHASADDPAAATATYRAAKDLLFRDHPQSPLLPERRAGFGGLPYWPYDPAWRLRVPLEPFGTPAAGPHDESVAAAPEGGGAAGGFGSPFGGLTLPNSGSSNPTFRRIGRVVLTGPLAGQQLAVFWLEGYGGGLFVPFRDATAGRDTYGAGRYLVDTIKGADHGGDAATGELLLDFNMAYHPSCAYDPRWSCPLAPPENRLSVPVPVGERLA
ncbi:MAG TPA: DUF1684 domain-containing protein [Candidatus Sulfotelmatobacter sp.]|nr:DUF1684 domain-containing protein [Candidatus Sulfotelmatobacter sp.]